MGEAPTNQDIEADIADSKVKELDRSEEEDVDVDRISTTSSNSSVLASEVLAANKTSERPRSVSSSRSRAAVVVPRSQRRGLFARFAIIPEVTQPTDYENKTKWIITAIVAIAGSAAPMGSAIILPALSDVAEDFRASDTITNLSVALYMLSMAIFPLWWSSFSETLGRRTIYITSFTLFVVFGILSAEAQNIAWLIVTRMLNGGASASVQAVGAGTIADIWEPKERGFAMNLFYLGPLCGPLIAPIVGGALAQSLGWRSTQWFLVIYGALMVAAIVFLLPETLKARVSLAAVENEAEKEAVGGKADTSDSSRPTNLRRVSTRQSVQLKTKKWATVLKKYFIDPLSIVLYLRFPVVFITVAYASITFCCLYILNISIQQTFGSGPYNFSTLIVGLLYIPNSLGYVLASLCGGKWIDRIMHREARKAGRYDGNGKLILRPEDRMRENAWLGAFLFPAALIAYGWTAQYGIIWIVPMVANFFFGVGSMLIFALATTMLTEFLPHKASSGIAVNNFVRNIFSCAGAIAAEPIIVAIGNGWLFTILGIVAFIAGPLVIVSMKRYGAKWSDSMQKKLGLI